ncbi:MAG: SDR family oxidoreductase [Actinomycetota bacterium]|nr:SDR family oxidoreductase [Actinomycetota bacterium]
MGRFSGKIALVTGAASGVGRATTRQLAEEGAKVSGIDINGEGLSALAEELGESFHFSTCDISDRDSSRNAVEECVKYFGSLDIVANVAGIVRSHHATDVDEETWRMIMGVNLDGMFWITQAAIPHLLETSGNIVNVASNAGFMGQAYTVPYCAAKGAVINMTRALAMEYIKTDLRVNAIAPGGMKTAMTENWEVPEGIDFELMKTYTGFRGMAEPETAAQAICWMASDEAARCTGSILSVDGGLTAA